MTSGMGQDVGAVLEGKLPEIARLVEQEFEKEKRRGGMMYQTRAQIGDFMPCVRIYLFADSLQPFESDRLSAENMGGRWSDIHVGGWYGNFYLEAFSHLEQDRDSLLACLEKRICPSFSCLAHYMGADAIVTPCWVYYGPEDPEATPMEFGWVSPTVKQVMIPTALAEKTFPCVRYLALFERRKFSFLLERCQGGFA